MNRAQPRIPTLLCTDKSYCKPRGLNQGFSFVRVRKWHHFSSTKDISLASSLARASTCDLIIATTNRRQAEKMRRARSLDEVRFSFSLERCYDSENERRLQEQRQNVKSGYITPRLRFDEIYSESIMGMRLYWTFDENTLLIHRSMAILVDWRIVVFRQ
jgi:hypothetical protein